MARGKSAAATSAGNVAEAVSACAEDILKAYKTAKPIAPIRTRLPANDVDAAYAVQKATVDQWLKDGRRLIGRKIGLTAKAVQRQMGVDQPDYGMLFADMCFGDGEDIPAAKVMQPKVEAEIAAIIGRDLDQGPYTVADLIRSVEYVVPAIEVVGSRIAKWEISLVDTIADNASAGLFVLGGPARRLEGLDLRTCGMVMEIKGNQVSVGAGAACMGHPLNAAVWLVNKMIAVGAPLKAGDVVMTGALGPMAGVQFGDVVEARISGLGSVRAIFSPD